MDEAPEARERSVSKPKGGQQYQKISFQVYITEGVILILKSLFYLSKGTDDIRMVFDTTVSVLNDSLRDLNFMLPSMGSFLMMLGP